MLLNSKQMCASQDLFFVFFLLLRRLEVLDPYTDVHKEIAHKKSNSVIIFNFFQLTCFVDLLSLLKTIKTNNLMAEIQLPSDFTT